METLLPPIQDPLLIFGGPYGNLQATLALREIAEAASIPPDRVICTGDLTAYCAQPSETISLIREWGIHCIKGNVEVQLAEGLEGCGCNFSPGSVCDQLSQHWYQFTQKEVRPDQIAWLRTLPDHLRFRSHGLDCLVVHGTYRANNRFIFPSTPWEEKEEELQSAQADVIIAGHSGIPFSQSREGQLWCNAGVIGMPANDGTTRGWYALLEPTESSGLSCSHHSFHYPHQITSDRMAQHHLPAEYRETLQTGIWNNCDILPERETAEQGQALSPGTVELSPLPLP